MLLKRIATSLVLGALTAAGLFWPGRAGAAWFLILALALIALILGETAGILRRAGMPVFVAPTIGAGMLLIAGALAPALCSGAHAWAGAWEAATLTLFLAWTAGLAARQENLEKGVGRLLASCGALLFIFGTLGWMPRLYAIEGDGMGGRWLLLFMVGVTKGTDIGAYAVGTLTARRPQGNHKMCPRLSPKKSWEGLAGGLGLGLIVALALFWAFGDRFAVHGHGVLAWWSAALFGLLFAVLGLAGDLTESVLKRAAGVKDSGSLPGLGGGLDVVDSLIFVTPLFYAYVAWMQAQ